MSGATLRGITVHLRFWASFRASASAFAVGGISESSAYSRDVKALSGGARTSRGSMSTPSGRCENAHQTRRPMSRQAHTCQPAGVVTLIAPVSIDPVAVQASQPGEQKLVSFRRGHASLTAAIPARRESRPHPVTRGKRARLTAGSSSCVCQQRRPSPSFAALLPPINQMACQSTGGKTPRPLPGRS